MVRNLKALGLALVAIFALSAMAASAASAQNQGTLTTDGPVTLHATEIGAKGSGNNALTALGARTECFGSTLTGHKIEKTPHERLVTGETKITVTPHYKQKECRFVLLGVERPATVTMNGCDYDLTIGQTTGGVAHTYGVTADITCPPNKSIELHVYKTPTPFTHEAHTNPENSFCTIKVHAQNNIPGAHVTTDTPPADDITITGTFEPIVITKEGSGCGTGEVKDAKFDINVTVKGTNAGGETTGVTVTDP